MTSRPLHAVLLPPEAAAGRMFEALAAALDGSGPAILPLDPSLPRSRLDELIEAFAPATMETAGQWQRLAPAGPARPTSLEDVAVVLATSGSTGRPRGAELSAAALLASARASLARLGAGPGERWLCCLPTHHISGLGVLVRSLVAGTTPLVRPRLAADQVAQAITAGCAYASLVPTQLRRLLDAGPLGSTAGGSGGSPPHGSTAGGSGGSPPHGSTALAGLRGILLGGAAMPDGLTAQAQAAGLRIVTTYGMTETCGGCVYDGLPLDGVRVSATPDGRIKIAGPVLFRGYRLDPELTRAALEGGWFVTSDLGGPGPDGKVVVRGRVDDVINSGGEKVVAGEVEDALRACPQVRDVVVIAVSDPDWGERVTALIVPADQADPPGLELLRLGVRDRLPRHAMPRAVVHLAEIPLLASGKPDRQRLRQIAARLATSDATR